MIRPCVFCGRPAISNVTHIKLEDDESHEFVVDGLAHVQCFDSAMEKGPPLVFANNGAAYEAGEMPS